MEAIVLAGGLERGWRRSLSGIPKALAPIAARPFLEILLNRLTRAGCARAFYLLCFRVFVPARRLILSSKSHPQMDEFRGQVSRLHLSFQRGKDWHICCTSDPLKVACFVLRWISHQHLAYRLRYRT